MLAVRGVVCEAAMPAFLTESALVGAICRPCTGSGSRPGRSCQMETGNSQAMG